MDRLEFADKGGEPVYYLSVSGVREGEGRVLCEVSLFVCVAELIVFTMPYDMNSPRSEPKGLDCTLHCLPS